MRKSVVQARRLVGKTAARELVPTMPGTSARWHMHDYGPYCRWHYHPEFEIHLIQHGTGRSIVGDHIGRFTAGHLVLVGSNLPHDWISDVGDGERITNRDVVFQFHPQWIRDCQQLLPELRAVDPLLARAARGIEFTGPTAMAAARGCSRSATAQVSTASTTFWRCSTSSAPPQRKPNSWPAPGYHPGQRRHRRPYRRRPQLPLHQQRTRDQTRRRRRPSRHV